MELLELIGFDSHEPREPQEKILERERLDKNREVKGREERKGEKKGSR